MTEPRRIPVERPTDLPTVSVLAGGERLSPEYHLSGITIQKSVGRIPSAVLTFTDGDASAQEFPLSSAPEFVPGSEIEITAGYHSDEQTVFKGIVTGQGLKVRRGRPGILVVQCRDEAVKLTTGRKSGYYFEKSDADIVEEILGEQGLESEVSSTSPTHASMVRCSTTDWDFIVSRAEANGMVVQVEDGVVKLVKPALSDAALTLVYGATLMEFEAELNAPEQIAEAAAVAWDPAAQALVEGEGEDPGLDGPGNLSPAELAAVVDQPIVLRHTGALGEEELKGWADARLLRSRLAKIIGRARCQGFAEIRPGATIALEGVGDRFSGDVYVAGVQHDLTLKNWLTTVQFGLDAAWFSQVRDVTDLPASGLLPAVHGLQIGVVTQLGDDPDGEDRIKVVMPIVNAEEEGIWARVASLDAGDSRGAFFRPEIGDEVVLGFLNDDPRQAIVLGMLHSSAKPAPLSANDDNHEKGFFTRSEMRVHFNDDTVVLTIDTPNGNSIQLSEEDGSITIQDENQNSVVMSADGVQIESAADVVIKASGDVKIEGTNVDISASASLKAEGASGAEVSTSGNAVLKGSLVQIN